MEGKILVSYQVLCDSDVNIEFTLKELLENDKISKAIKSEFSKGVRNIDLFSNENGAKLYIKSSKEKHTLEVEKDDFADLLELAESDAVSKKLFKKDCSRVELINIETI